MSNLLLRVESRVFSCLSIFKVKLISDLLLCPVVCDDKSEFFSITRSNLFVISLFILKNVAIRWDDKAKILIIF